MSWRGKSAVGAVLAVLIIVGSGIRFHELGGDSLWYDEAASWQQAHGTFAQIFERTARDNYPPLHNLLLYASINLLGDTEWALRMPSAVLGVAAIAAICWVGHMGAGSATGLVAAALLTFSPFNVSYSREGRMYTLMALAAICFAGACWRTARSPSAVRLATMILAGMALLYSHPYGTFYWLTIAVAATGLATPWQDDWRRSVRAMVIGGVVSGLSFLPWAIVLMGRASSIQRNGFWIAPASFDGVLRILTSLAGGARMANLATVGILVAILPRWSKLRALADHSQDQGAVEPVAQRLPGSRFVFFLLSWALVPIAIAVVVSWLTRPILISRYVIASSPALLLAASCGFARFGSGFRQWIPGSAVSALAVSALIAARPFAFTRADWRAASAHLNVSLQRGDCVLIVPPYNRIAFWYYRRQRYCDLQLRDGRLTNPQRRRPRRVFAIVDGSDKRIGDKVERQLADNDLVTIERTHFRKLDIIKARRAPSADG